MHTLEELEALAEQGEASLDACLLPVEAGLADFPSAVIEAGDAVCLGHGQPVQLAGVPAADPVAIHDASGRALGLGRVDQDAKLHPRRLFIWATPHAR